MPVGSPAGSRSTTPPGTSSRSVTASAAELTHSEWPSCARSAIFTPGAIASSAWRVGFSLHSSSRQPRPRSQPPGLHLGRGHALERLGERGAAEQPQLAPAERPAREVHVRVDEARHDAAADLDPRHARGWLVEHRGDPAALHDDDRGGERALRVQRAHAAPASDGR